MIELLKAAGTITPPGISRKQGHLAALFIARRFRGADRIDLLQECGLLPYEPGKRQKARGCATTTVSYRRPGT